MKQMTVKQLTARRSTYMNRITCTFEYIMNKTKIKFEHSAFLLRQAQGLLFAAQLHGGPQQVSKFPGDDGPELLVGG